MEEKERYEWRYSSKVLKHYIVDNRDCKQLGYKEIFALLNQQDKRIKELELLLNADKKMEANSVKGFEKLKQENQQLKSQPKEIVEKVRAYCNIKWFDPEFVDKERQETVVSYAELINFLDTILKEYEVRNDR